MTSPAIRRRAKEAGVDLTLVPGSGPGGRIQRTDFDTFLKAQRYRYSVRHGAQCRRRTIKEIKVIGLRRIIAERMTSGETEIPHFAYVEEIDITELESLRKHLNSAGMTSEQTDAAAVSRARTDPGTQGISAVQRRPTTRSAIVLLQYDAVHLGRSNADTGRPEGSGR